MKTKLFYYQVPNDASPQEVPIIASQVVRDSHCDIIFVDQFTHDLLVKRAGDGDDWYSRLMPHFEASSLVIAGRPVGIIPAAATGLVRVWRGQGRVAVLTVN